MWIVATVSAATNALPQPPLQTIELNAGVHRIEAEVASTTSARGEGLMHRSSMPASHGMLFVFPEGGRHCMWMRNTLIPLSAAFIDTGGVIINVAEMQPQTLDNHCAVKDARFVLEMNGGWFRSRGIGSGARIFGLEKAPPGR
jgi:uncharacterized membrane protein (UPF0127 family)